MGKNSGGVIAAGHELTVQAARTILEDGGNAFDAAVAAHLAACFTEPVLASLAGGGFMLGRTSGGRDILYDFFVQTPVNKRKENVEFYPIMGNFGETEQEFHIGAGSAATPGTVKGLFAIHRDLCTMPMDELARPAIEMGMNGVKMNHFQAYILQIIKPIYLATPGAVAIFGSPGGGEDLIVEGELFRQPDLAGTIDALTREGADLFYRGELAKKISRLCEEHGGHLTAEDLAGYEVIRRKPLNVNYRGNHLLTNPAPSSGGTLIAFALKLLEEIPAELISKSAENGAWLHLLAGIQEMTDRARIDDASGTENGHPSSDMLDSGLLDIYREQIRHNPRFSRGTTQISIIDGMGNMAALSASNGEGSGLVVPGTGIMLNNMLGEEDLNPGGFNNWACNRRMTSMMAPSILLMPGNRSVALGSGGSNRLRTAILQVILNLTDLAMPPDEAVNSPRIHYENGILSIEDGFSAGDLEELIRDYPGHKIWNGKNLFFGGVHVAGRSGDNFYGAGDPRRGGVSVILE
ncbi:MAG: Gamma-glutamyltranspeptidase [Balneolaceae bacterium]|nr:MAG: Gamma-glutamyltranspeptidase [Balneolaceae bacterium]